MNSDGRIPISKGFSISFSADGRALIHGRPESGVPALEAVEDWLLAHTGHDDYELAKKWIQRERERIAEDERIQAERAEREKINVDLDRLAGPKRISSELEKITRAMIFKARGIPQRED